MLVLLPGYGVLVEIFPDKFALLISSGAYDGILCLWHIE